MVQPLWKKVWKLFKRSIVEPLHYSVFSLPATYLKKRKQNMVRHLQFSSVQLLSRVRLFETSWSAVWQVSLSIANSCFLKLMFIESVMPCSHVILCRPLLLPPSIFPSIRVFSNESAFHIGGQSTGASASGLPVHIQG